jgi:hypothetical protein
MTTVYGRVAGSARIGPHDPTRVDPAERKVRRMSDLGVDAARMMGRMTERIAGRMRNVGYPGVDEEDPRGSLHSVMIFSDARIASACGILRGRVTT